MIRKQAAAVALALGLFTPFALPPASSGSPSCLVPEKGEEGTKGFDGPWGTFGSVELA